MMGIVLIYEICSFGIRKHIWYLFEPEELVLSKSEVRKLKNAMTSSRKGRERGTTGLRHGRACGTYPAKKKIHDIVIFRGFCLLP